MLEPAKISEIVTEVATGILTRQNVEQVLSRDSLDSQGDGAVVITLVLKPAGFDLLEGGPVLDLLLQIRQQLERAGEERTPIVEYATLDELDDLDDPES